MNNYPMLAIFAIATLALIVPITMNIQPAYSQAKHCRDTSVEGQPDVSTNSCTTTGSDPIFSETGCSPLNGVPFCYSVENTNQQPSSSNSAGGLHSSCSERQSTRDSPVTQECSVQPDDNAR